MPFYSPNLHFGAQHKEINLVQGQLSGLLNGKKPHFKEKPEAETQGRVMYCQLTFWGPNDTYWGKIALKPH